MFPWKFSNDERELPRVANSPKFYETAAFVFALESRESGDAGELIKFDKRFRERVRAS